MYVSVSIDPEDILDELEDDQLKRLGLQRIPSSEAQDIGPETRDVNWPSLGEAIRRRDFDRATELLTAIAGEHGYCLPPVVLASAA
jgi:hypothetical protein